MSRGYIGKILRVDLSNHRLTDEIVDENMARQFLGGYGLGARIIFDGQQGGIDPLGTESILGFLTGPLTGTPAISGTRFTVAGKSPLTGGWGDANSGGDFGAFLKFSGYDAVLFTGISEKPVYLLIDNGKAELKDAAHLWGKDTNDIDDILKSELGKDTAIACIGQSGEKLARIASVVHNKGSVAARSGLGAVMGAKRLKAVAVKGNMKVPLGDEPKVMELRKKYLPQVGGHVEVLKKFGTSFVTVVSAKTGDSPVKNWGGIAKNDFPDVEPLSAETLDTRKQKAVACYRCPVGCEAILKEGTGEYKYPAGSFRPEYETIAMLGTNCLNNNIESVIKANDLCNRYGIDTISTGAIIAFAMECYEKGVITRADTDGIDMSWGNHQAVVAMTEKLAKREGFGDVLADGVRVAAQRIGRGAGEYAIHVNGQEVPGHSPIGSFYWTATYLASATPARHTQGSEGKMQDLPKFDPKGFSGRGKAHKMGMAIQNSLMSCGMCLFVLASLPGTHVMVEFLAAVTGWDIDRDELVTIGERIENMRQAFNVREGINLLDFDIPGRILGKPPHKDGPLAGITVDAETQVKEYLAEMGWDLATAKPSRNRLTELGLADVAKELNF